MGFLTGGGPEGPGRTRTLPQVPGVGVQLGKPAVSRESLNVFRTSVQFSFLLLIQFRSK